MEDNMTPVKGKLLESKPKARIYSGFPYNLYEVLSSGLSKDEKRKAELLVRVITRSASLNALHAELGSKEKSTVEQFRNSVIQAIDVESLTQILPSARQYEILHLNLLPVTEKLGIEHKNDFIGYVLDHSIGYGAISPLMTDSQLEEIMVNGFERNVFVFHRHFGNCKTNIEVNEKSGLFNLIKRIAATVSKQFNEAHPLLDARLPDGSRANATFNYVSPFGHTLTIRKFSKIPLSVIDLIANNTIDSEVAAFLWTMVEGLGIHPMNTIITGGTGSGKTTLMNVLADFIPFDERIISIEDTIELDLGVRENWIQMESKPKMKDILAVSMDDLLKNTLRMRPDRIIVGEVRSQEAETLFVAMDTGQRGILGTLHSNSAREMMIRLKSAPMNVPEQMLPLLDMVIVMERHYDKRKGMVRSIKQITEVGRMDETVLLNNIYEFNEKTGRTERTKVPSELVEQMASSAGLSKNELKREIYIRKRILDFLLSKGVRSREEVSNTVQQYYFNQESVLRQLTKDL
jgi:flagellar protein FlaI